MAKYCKYCGKELEKGKECNCKKETKKVEERKSDELKKATETIKTEVANSSKKYFSKIGNVCKDMLIKPKEATKEILEENDFNITMILIVLSSIILAFCSVSFIKGIYTITSNSLQNPYSMNDLYYTGSGVGVWNNSYFKILCCICIGIVIGYILLAIIFQLGFERICKKEIGFKKTLSTIAISMVEPTIVGILSAFFTIFSYKLSIILIIYGILLFIVNLYQNYKIAGEVESEGYNRLFALFVILFTFLAIYLIPNLFL